MSKDKTDKSKTGKSAGHPLLGKNVFIRTVTHYHTGRLEEVSSGELVLSGAAWVAETGRFADAMANGKMDAVEPFPEGWLVRVNRSAIVDWCEWPYPLLREQV